MWRQEARDEIAPDDLAVISTPDLFLRMKDILIGEAVRHLGAMIIGTTILQKVQVVTALTAANPGTSEVGLRAKIARSAIIRAVPVLFDGIAAGAADGFHRKSGRHYAARGPGAGSRMVSGYQLAMRLTPKCGCSGKSRPEGRMMSIHGAPARLRASTVVLPAQMARAGRRSAPAGSSAASVPIGHWCGRP